MTAEISDNDRQNAMATFADGCFWCIQPLYDAEPGVVKTIVGYTGGHSKSPIYQQVSAGGSGHAEPIRILYDPAVDSYERLLEIF